MRLVGQAHQRQQVHRPLCALARRRSRLAEVHRQHHVLDDGQRGQQLEELEDDAHGAAAPLRHLALAEAGERVPPTSTSPDVGRSMPVIMLISVDLPLPDWPTIATNSPRVDLDADRLEGAERAGVGHVVLDHVPEVDEVSLGEGVVGEGGSDHAPDDTGEAADVAGMLGRGEVAERFKAALLKSAGRKSRGFESHPRRHAAPPPASPGDLPESRCTIRARTPTPSS